MTVVQKAHAEVFDKRTGAVKFDSFYYEKKKFGPWNPYWHVYNTIRQHRTGDHQRLLSFGCGNGRDAILYSKLGYDVYGIDISTNAIKIAHRLACEHGCEKGTHFSVQAAERLAFAADYFDIVVGTNVLHHVDMGLAVPEIARVLKPGGLAIFKEPLATPFRDKLRRIIVPSWLIPPGTKNIFREYRYDLVPGERNLDATSFEMIHEHFGNLMIKKWRCLALLNIILPWRVFLERCDWLLLNSLPLLRRFGDQAVLTFHKK